MIKVASVLILLLVLVILESNYNIAVSQVLCRGEEKHALLDFKLSFTADPVDFLSTWSINNPECCEWSGVRCDNRTGHVVSLVFGEGLESHHLRPSLLVLQHLTSLDFNYNSFTMRIPEFIGSLTKLTQLDLSYAGFFGNIPPNLGNLTQLQYLSLGENLLYVDNLQWLSHLSSLRVLDLTGINLSSATDWLSTLKMLPSLSAFYCQLCSLPPAPPLVSSMCLVNHSTSLQDIEISFISISSSNFSCLINGTNNLKRFNIFDTNLEQILPDFLGVLIRSARYSLKELIISGSDLTSLPPELMMFPLLNSLSISYNHLSQLLAQDISYNLKNRLPTPFSSLTYFDASFNRIKGNLHAILQHLPTNLTYLDLSANSLNGVISDAHFSKFSYLKGLDLSDNYLLEFNFSESRVPPFQLGSLKLRSCKLGPAFPNWVLTQKNLRVLDISNSSISGAVPSAFWDYSSRLIYLNISNNRIHCTIPNLSLVFENSPIIDLSFNDFHGPIPLFMFSARDLDLSSNKFSSFPTFHHEELNQGLSIINLSNNLLSGSLPNQNFQFNGLQILNLANNMLSGTIPIDISNLWHLHALHLNRNRFSGELPSLMKNCTELLVLELGYNNFSGSVPFWLGGSLQLLFVLNLRSNNFSGELPSNLCHLQRLQVLDLSSNTISGSIPGCVDNFTSMATYGSFSGLSSEYISYINGLYEYVDYASIMWKGILANESNTNLLQWNVIDLSNNCLTGKIPSEVTSLKYLRSLDISRNNLDGNIPDKIGGLKFLEVLKLSSNRLCGEIPQSLSSMNFLDALNLSSNNLSGRIPKSTQLQSFDPSSYAGNPELCGEPLQTKCPGDDVKPPPFGGDHTQEEANETFNFEAFFAALGAGFACSFLGILGILNFHARSRHAFFHMATEVGDWIFVKICLCQSRIKRSLGF